MKIEMILHILHMDYMLLLFVLHYFQIRYKNSGFTDCGLTRSISDFLRITDGCRKLPSFFGNRNSIFRRNMELCPCSGCFSARNCLYSFLFGSYPLQSGPCGIGQQLGTDFESNMGGNFLWWNDQSHCTARHSDRFAYRFNL